MFKQMKITILDKIASSFVKDSRWGQNWLKSVGHISICFQQVLEKWQIKIEIE